MPRLNEVTCIIDDEPLAKRAEEIIADVDIAIGLVI